MAGERLRIVNGPLQGQALELDQALVLGRRETGPGNLGGDDELSRRHASLTRAPDGRIVVEDLGSTNGTLVNGAKIQAPTVLRPGDKLQVGMTELELVDEDRTQVDRDIPPALAAQAAPLAPPPSPAAAAAPPVAAPKVPAPPPVGAAAPPLAPQTPFQAPPQQPPRKRRGGLVVLWVLVGIVAVVGIGAAVYFATKGGGDSGGGGASVASDCGKNIGAGGAQVAFVTYVESNIAKDGDKNSVIAIPYGADLKPQAMSQCPTGGSGSTDLTDSGVLDANGQIAIDRAKKVLFAVNQGSDTIAAFKIADNGGLTPVNGSPFPSGGKAPAGMGVSDDTLVVANKAQDGVRDLTTVAPNYTTFKIGADGALTQVPNSNVTAEPKSSPTDAYVPPEGAVAFSTEESGPLRAFTVSSDGVLAQGPGSPHELEPAAFAEGFDPAKKFALGLVSHPTQDILYVSYPTVPALTVYTYDDTAALRYESGQLNSGAYLPCWNVITPDGRFLYTSNADTNNVTVFDLADPLRPKQIQTLTFQTPGNPWNAAVDESGKYLVVITPRDTLKVPEGEGNTMHVMQIGADGKLTEPNGAAPAKIPVPSSANPQGLAIMPGPGSSS